MATDTKLFGRYQEIVLLLVSFVLTGIVGSYLGSKFQDQSWEHQWESQRQEREIAAATGVFDNISRLMDKRLYRARLLLWALQRPTPANEISARWADYRSVLYEWNDSLNRNLALVDRYFGGSMRNQLEEDIHHGLRELGKYLEDYRSGDHQDPVMLSAAASLADRVNNSIYAFNIEMLEAIQAGSVGTFQVRVEQ